MTQKYHTMKEAGEILGVSWKRVREWIRSGELSAVNVSRDRRSKKPQFRVSATVVCAIALVLPVQMAHGEVLGGPGE